MAKIDNSEVCTLIRERLEHVELVFDLRHHYHNMELVQWVGENGWTHPWRYFDALMYYLLLTCFDLLGQPADWVPFSIWLESRKKAGERNAAVAKIPASLDAVAIAKHLNTAYQSIYGVKNSFYHFVQHVLTDEERNELYLSIQIARGRQGGDPNTSYPALGYIEGEKEKLDWLFSLRNKFTHSAVTMGNPGAGIFPQSYDATIIDGKPMKGYLEIHRESKSGEWVIYQVRDWPFVLQRLIRAVLASREQHQSCS